MTHGNVIFDILDPHDFNNAIYNQFRTVEINRKVETVETVDS